MFGIRDIITQNSTNIVFPDIGQKDGGGHAHFTVVVNGIGGMVAVVTNQGGYFILVFHGTNGTISILIIVRIAIPSDLQLGTCFVGENLKKRGVTRNMVVSVTFKHRESDDTCLGFG